MPAISRQDSSKRLRSAATDLLRAHPVKFNADGSLPDEEAAAERSIERKIMMLLHKIRKSHIELSNIVEQAAPAPFLFAPLSTVMSNAATMPMIITTESSSINENAKENPRRLRVRRQEFMEQK